MKFVVYAPPYRADSGGVIALHKLAHNLTLLGEEAYIYTSIKNPDYLGIQTQDNWMVNDSVVIYPEIVSGNPLGAKRVVRWLLNTPGALGGDGKYEDTDLVYKYVPIFKSPVPHKGILRAMDLKLDKYVDKGLPRLGQCYTVRKGTNMYLHEQNAIYFDHTISEEKLIELFNTTETFICYDELSFLLHQAALCGCDAVAIPTIECETEEAYRNGTDYKYGVAYGLGDIGWANAENCRIFLLLVSK
jgi:hypothetical protein